MLSDASASWIQYKVSSQKAINTQITKAIKTDIQGYYKTDIKKDL